MRRRFLTGVLVLGGVFVCAGCAPFDPPRHWEVFEAPGGGHRTHIAIAVEAYTAWSKTYYSGCPSVRFIDQDERTWELEMPLSSPNTWKLWTWMLGEQRVRVPLTQTAKVSQWGHSTPPWGQEVQAPVTQPAH